jgi:methylamine dehydrogenase accessory protein MauD
VSGAWLVSYIALWAVVLFQGAVIFMLLRQLGVIYLGTAQGIARDGLPAGARAPDFAAASPDGRTVSLADFRGRLLLLVFGSPTCAPCRLLIPDLNAFAQDRRDELSVLFLSRSSVEEARAFAEGHGLAVPVAAHPDERLPDSYRARVTPFAFLIDAEGVVRAKSLANNREHLEMLLRAAAGAAGQQEGSRHRNGAQAEERTAVPEVRS